MWRTKSLAVLRAQHQLRGDLTMAVHLQSFRSSTVYAGTAALLLVASLRMAPSPSTMTPLAVGVALGLLLGWAFSAWWRRSRSAAVSKPEQEKRPLVGLLIVLVMLGVAVARVRGLWALPPSFESVPVDDWLVFWWISMVSFLATSAFGLRRAGA